MSGKSDEAPRVRLEAVMVTDVGVVRDHNEDCAHVDDDGAFFIVADGMGGHAAGEVASEMAVATVKTTLEVARPQIRAFATKPTEQGRRDLVSLLQGSVLAAHQAVFQRGSKESDKQGMGTTLDVVMVAGSEAFIAHVGDSRTYLVRDGRASQITTDHTVAEVLVIEGKLSIEEAQVSPLRTILVNAIGVSADVGVEMAHLQLKRDDRLLVCSDGLHDYFLAEEEIAERMVPPNDQALEPALRDMVEIAKERGGHDNITGIAVRVLDLPDAVPAPIEPDETQPVEAAKPTTGAAGWGEDEHTETSTPSPLDIETAPTIPPSVRPALAAMQKATQPLKVVKPGEPEIKMPERNRGEVARADTVPPPKDEQKRDKKDAKEGKIRKGRGKTSKPPASAVAASPAGAAAGAAAAAVVAAAGDVATPKKRAGTEPEESDDEDEKTQEHSPIEDK